MLLMGNEEYSLRRLFFDTHEEVSEYMVSMAKDGKCVEAVVYYDEAIKLIRDFAQFDNVEFEAISVKPYDFMGYDKEYLVYLASDMVLSVEPAKMNGVYLNSEADIHLIDADASSSILKSLLGGEQIEMYIGENDDVDNNIDNVIDKLNEIFSQAKITKDKMGNITGIEINNKDLKFYYKKNFIDWF